MKGSLIQKKAGGNYCLKLSGGWNEAKKRYDQMWINLETSDPKEAEKRQIKILADMGEGAYVEPSRMTVSQFLNEWLKEHVEKECGKSTKRWYRMVIRNHINPMIGKIPVTKLTALDIQKTVYAPNKDTQRMAIYSTLSAALNMAVRPWKLIKSNPVEDINKPELDEVDYVILDYDQIAKFLEIAKETSSHRDYCIYLLALNTGMRLDEILGLRWIDFNFDKMFITVNQQVVGVGNQTEFGKPKSKKKRRIIMVEEVAFEIKKARQQQRLDKMRIGPNWEEHGLIFTTTIHREGQPAGRPVDGSKLSKRGFKRILKEAELPDMRFHDLRHSFATYLLGKGVDIKTVSEMLGHSSVKVTEKYLHLGIKIQEAAIPALKAIVPKN